jgi:flagellar biosynthesis/type III secretory pathway protein FliH
MTVGLALTMLLGGCGESREEAYERGAEDGFEPGFDEGEAAGLEEAYECVRDEGGSTEDAADNCE